MVMLDRAKAISTIRTTVIAAAISISTAGFANAQVTTDAAAQIQSALKSFGPVPILTFVDVHGLPGAPIRIPIETHAILSASNITVVSTTQPVFGAEAITSFPVNVSQASWLWVNCDATPQPNYSGQVTYTEQRTASISISNGVTNTVGGEIDFGYSSGGGGGFSLGGKISGSRSWTTTQVDQNTFQSAFAVNNTVSVASLPAKSALAAETTVTEYNITVPFTATVTVDADVQANLKGYKKLSDVIADLSKRTFKISGSVAEVNWEDSVTTTSSVPFQASMCVGALAPRHGVLQMILRH